MQSTTKKRVIGLLITGLFAFILPVPSGLLGLITPVSLIIFILLLKDIIVDFFRNRKNK